MQDVISEVFAVQFCESLGNCCCGQSAVSSLVFVSSHSEVHYMAVHISCPTENCVIHQIQCHEMKIGVLSPRDEMEGGRVPLWEH
jgi:hypothetical protein